MDNSQILRSLLGQAGQQAATPPMTQGQPGPLSQGPLPALESMNNGYNFNPRQFAPQPAPPAYEPDFQIAEGTYEKPEIDYESRQMPTNLEEYLQKVDLSVKSAKRTDKKAEKSESDFAFYEPDPQRTPIPTRGKDADKALIRDLHNREGSAASFLATLDKSADEIRKNPQASMIPLTESYNNLAALEKGIIEDGRKMFGSGATFTEFEIANILDQIGPFYGPGVAKQPSAALNSLKGNPEERIRRLEMAQDLIMQKVDKQFQSAGYRRKQVVITGPDGRSISVDALEAPRASRLAQDKQKWAQFVDSLEGQE